MTDVLMEIGGESTASFTGETFESTSPSTGEVVHRVARGGAEDVDEAVRAATRAQREWASLSGQERGRILTEYAAVIEKATDELAEMDAREGGNPVTAMRRDVGAALEGLRYFAGLATEVVGKTFPAGDDVHAYTRLVPFGVTARMLAYNHPALFAIRGLGATLAVGNASIMKPSEYTNASAVRIAELWRGVGPTGLVNCVTGFGHEVGDSLVRHPAIRRLSFTGGVENGRRVNAAAAEHLKYVTLELGGKNPLIVLPDADVDDVVDAAISCMNYSWSLGQSCQSSSRLFVHQELYPEVVDALASRVSDLVPGDPMDPANQIGCMVSFAARDRVEAIVDRAAAAGAVVRAGGRRPEGAEFDRGAYYLPTLITDASVGSEIAQTEIFGPVQTIFEWCDEEDLLRAVNSVEQGLTANIWTSDLNAAHRMVRSVTAGYVWVNSKRSASSLYLPLGGMKASGLGREKGLDELYSFVQNQSVEMHLGSVGPALGGRSARPPGAR